MQKADSLIRTKLHRPFTGPGVVPRPRLQERLAEGLHRPLTLIVAPAGFGKTTLVAAFAAACGMPVGWLSLDNNDNVVSRFLGYLVAALQVADAAIGGDAAERLEAAQQSPPEAILTSLINDLDSVPGDMALVLDDYQFINDREVHAALAFLLAHCPVNFHVLLATRSDPPLPAAHLRARGQMVELRTADLRFTEPEAAQFLNELMGLRLDARSVAVLEERTEGWVAGLQLASITLQSHRSPHEAKDVSAFIEAFSGTNRYILDYLLEEVLASQPPEIQQFLLSTSILERFTAPLCDAVMANAEAAPVDGDRGAASTPAPAAPVSPRSAAMLEYVERANLFLVPLDNERQWYRYHHLFADLLRARLPQSLDARKIAALHARAAGWYEQNGLTYEAIRQASLTGDDEWVERLIEQNYMQMFQRGDASSVIRFWTGELSKEFIYKRPRLSIYEATSCAWFGQVDEADAFLDEAEKRLRAEVPRPETRAMLGHLAYVRSRVAAMHGNIHRAIELSLSARDNTPAGNQALLGGIGVMLAYGYFLDGNFATAIQTLCQTIESGRPAQALNSTVGAYCVLARLYTIQGQLQKAFDVYREAEQFAREAAGRNLGVLGVVDVGMAEVLCEWNDLEAAMPRMKEGLEFLPHWNKPDDLALAYVTLVRIQLAQGDAAGASGTIDKALQLVRSRGVFSEARDAVSAAEIRLRLAKGFSPEVPRWASAREQDLGTGGPVRFVSEWAHLTLARVYLAQSRLDECTALLSRLEADAASGGRNGRLIEILLLKALAFQKSGEPGRALTALAKSLALAEPAGYTRVFADEGSRLQPLLAQWTAQARPGSVRDYANHLLAQIEAERLTGPAAAHSQTAPAGGLVDPLTPRELAVLQLIAEGRSNQDIARQFVVAVGTVKSQAASIYRKLDVTNRTEAVARARQLAILP